jgi:hypothetical protein
MLLAGSPDRRIIVFVLRMEHSQAGKDAAAPSRTSAENVLGSASHSPPPRRRARGPAATARSVFVRFECLAPWTISSARA